MNCVPPKVYTIDELEKLHTKQLLKMRYGSIVGDYNYDCKFCQNYNTCASIVNTNRRFLYSILNNREHIPNKIESKALRKQRKKQGN